MSDERKGLTKPLVSNVGGVVDQAAPSADELLEGQTEGTLDKAGHVTGNHVDTPSPEKDSVVRSPLGGLLGITPRDPGHD